MSDTELYLEFFEFSIVCSTKEGIWRDSHLIQLKKIRMILGDRRILKRCRHKALCVLEIFAFTLHGCNQALLLMQFSYLDSGSADPGWWAKSNWCLIL